LLAYPAFWPVGFDRRFDNIAALIGTTTLRWHCFVIKQALFYLFPSVLLFFMTPKYFGELNIL